jgi:hypothetical protein
MEGEGAYNKYAKLPAGGGALALPLLEKAVDAVRFEAGNQPIVIADYGSSQGKNSLVPMKTALKGMRRRLGADRPLSVIHIDQPSNDFNTLFEVLDADPDRYTLDDPNVFPAAIGRSFYEGVLPPGSVHLGWCSYAAVWLRRIPALIPDHFVSFLSSSAQVRAEFDREAESDWRAFLTMRARELRPGGRLVVVLPARADDGSTGFEKIMNEANAVLEEMVSDGDVTAAERARMVVPTYPRRTRDLLAPFERVAHFEGLTIEELVTLELPDAAWSDYEQDGNSDALATKHALFFRSIFMPSLAASLDGVRSGAAGALAQFADRLQSRLTRRLTRVPTAMHSFVQTILLARG